MTMSNRHIQIQALQGVPLASDWQRQAGARAAEADRAYMERLRNSWKNPIGMNTQRLQEMGVPSLPKGNLPPLASNG
jgi:hypothetical protein